jgi:hypothetical protein
MKAADPVGTENIWTCKIGGAVSRLPPGADAPMRNAVFECFRRLAESEAQFCFSGWSGVLTESERAVVENRLPAAKPEPTKTARPALSDAEVRRLWLNSPEVHKDLASFAAFARTVRMFEDVYGITAPEKSA